MFLPPRTNPPLVRALFEKNRVTFLATDLYTIGQDSADLDHGPEAPAEIWIDQPAAKQLEAAARKDCVPKSRAPIEAPDGQGHGIFTYHQGDALTFAPQLDHTTVSAQDHTGQQAAAGVHFTTRPQTLWEASQALLSGPLPSEGLIPRPLMADPALLGRFARVKAPGKELAHIDMWPADEGRILQLRIGSRFRGALMCIDRERVAQHERAEQDGLW